MRGVDIGVREEHDDNSALGDGFLQDFDVGRGGSCHHSGPHVDPQIVFEFANCRPDQLSGVQLALVPQVSSVVRDENARAPYVDDLP